MALIRCGRIRCRGCCVRRNDKPELGRGSLRAALPIGIGDGDRERSKGRWRRDDRELAVIGNVQARPGFPPELDTCCTGKPGSREGDYRSSVHGAGGGRDTGQSRDGNIIAEHSSRSRRTSGMGRIDDIQGNRPGRIWWRDDRELAVIDNGKACCKNTTELYVRCAGKSGSRDGDDSTSGCETRGRRDIGQFRLRVFIQVHGREIL